MSLPYQVQVKVNELQEGKFLLLPASNLSSSCFKTLLYHRLPFTFGWQDLLKLPREGSLMSPQVGGLSQVLSLNVQITILGLDSIPQES